MISGRYSIKDLEKITGIKAHTIRIWEQRYGLLNPHRTDTNIRYYDDEDLQFILNVSVLNKNGFKISLIADLTKEEVMQEVRQLTTTAKEQVSQISGMVLSMLHLDEESFEKIVSHYVKMAGFERTMIELIYPFLDHIGTLWLTGAIRPAHEHFVSNLIRQRIITSTQLLKSKHTTTSRSFLLFAPEKEIHEISLLFVQYLLKSRGFKTYYIGPNTPYTDLITIAHEKKPDFLLTIVTSQPAGMSLLKLVNDLIEDVPLSKLVISGIQANMIANDLPDNVLYFSKLNAFINHLENISDIHNN